MFPDQISSRPLPPLPIPWFPNLPESQTSITLGMTSFQANTHIHQQKQNQADSSSIPYRGAKFRHIAVTSDSVVKANAWTPTTFFSRLPFQWYSLIYSAYLTVEEWKMRLLQHVHTGCNPSGRTVPAGRWTGQPEISLTGHFPDTGTHRKSSHMAMFNSITCNSFPISIASPRAILFTFYIGRILAQSAARERNPIWKERNLFLSCKIPQISLNFFAIRLI